MMCIAVLGRLTDEAVRTHERASTRTVAPRAGLGGLYPKLYRAPRSLVLVVRRMLSRRARTPGPVPDFLCF